jgi:hypothetical protein
MRTVGDWLENLPDPEGPFDMAVAREMIETAVLAMEPDHVLAETFTGYSELLLSWCRSEQPIEMSVLHQLRTSLERIKGDHETGELLICAAKMGLSATLVAAPNPYTNVLDRREWIHDDIEPLVMKGVDHLHDINGCKEFDPTVRYDDEIELIAHDTINKGWLKDLIARAERPTQDA